MVVRQMKYDLDADGRNPLEYRGNLARRIQREDLSIDSSLTVVGVPSANVIAIGRDLGESLSTFDLTSVKYVVTPYVNTSNKGMKGKIIVSRRLRV